MSLPPDRNERPERGEGRSCVPATRRPPRAVRGRGAARSAETTQLGGPSPTAHVQTLSARPLAVLAPALLIALGILWIVGGDATRTAHADGTIHTHLGDDAGRVPETRIPTARPAWIDGDPLSEIGRLLGEGNASEARTMLLRFLDERDGQLVAPPDLAPGAERIPPPWQVLRDWSTALPPESRSGLRFPDELVARTLERGPIDAAHPLIWLDGLDELALRRLHEAIEGADHETARLLLHRPGLADRLHPTLRSWLHTVDAPPPADPLPRIPDGTLALEVRIPLDLVPNPVDSKKRAIPPRHRRIPLADLHPAIGSDTAILPGVHGPFGIELSPPYHRLWTIDSPYPPGPTKRQPLRDTSWSALANGTRLALPLRTPRVEYSGMIEWIYETHDWHERGWTSAALLRWDGGRDEPKPFPVPGWSLEGFTVGGTPLVIDGRVHWLATRGFTEVETWVLTADLESGEELWRRPLSVRTLPWLPADDLSDVQPAGRIIAHRDACFVLSRGGLIARLGRRSGDLRGVLLTPRHLRTAQTGLLARIKTGKTEALRLRPNCAAWVTETGPGAERLIALPPDGAQILALDLAGWSIAWAQARPALPYATIHRGEDDTPWVIDLTTLAGASTVRAWSLDRTTGRVRGAGPVELEIAEAQRRRRPPAPDKAPTREQLSPIVGGNPLLVEGGIAIPTRRGLAIWDRAPLAGGAPDRLLEWPVGSHGGTITFLPPNDEDHSTRILVLHRQDPDWSSRSVAELMRFVEGSEGSTGTGGESTESGNDEGADRDRR